nr:hypothetical protein [Flavobacteriaceae bacterium]
MKWTRRDVLKGLGALPIVGGVWWAGAASSALSAKEREAILEQLNIEPSIPAALPPIGGAPVRVGIEGSIFNCSKIASRSLADSALLAAPAHHTPPTMG